MRIRLRNSKSSPALSLLALGIAAPAAVSAQHADEEVIVIGTLRDASAADLAQSVTVLGGETLDRVRGVNLGETLEGQLGISASFFGTGASRPIIRGLAGARVRTLEDGIESMDVSTVSADHAVGIDPLVAQQIEIFRGPTTLLYGGGAVGGVINTVTNRIPEMAPEDGLDAVLEVRGDSVADERSAAFSIDAGADRFAWHADAARRRTGDFEIPVAADRDAGSTVGAPDPDAASGILENSDLQLASFALGGSWLGDNGFFGVSVGGFETEYGIPGHAHEEAAGGTAVGVEAAEEDVRIDLDQTRIDLKGGWYGLGGFVETINLRAGANDYEHVELEGADVGTRFTNEAYEGRLELLHRAIGQWSGAIGLQFGAREFAAIGDEAYTPPVDSTTYGAFIVEQLETERWALSLGLRYETQTHEPASAAAVDGSAVSVSAAAVRDLGNGYALAMNVGSAERLPVAEELFADGPHLASGTIEIGDAGLGREAARHFDIGLRKNAGGLTWSLTAFATEYDDFIYLRDTGIEDPDEQLPIFVYSQQDASFHGVEAELFVPIAGVGAGELDVRLFADYVRGELDGGGNVPRIPPLRYGARVAYHAGSIIAGLEATKYAEQDDIAAYETPTDGYTLVSADLDWAIPSLQGPELSLFLRASNLLDREARRHTSLVKDIAPLPGRNFALGFRARF